MKVRQAVVMVGGQGTRLRPLTENRPKPVLPVAGKPCIWYLLRSMADAGIEEIFLACGYRPEMISEALGDGSDLGVRLVYSYEKSPMGTGGALKLLESRLDPVFLAANGDVFADIDITGQIGRHFSSGADVIRLGVIPTPAVAYLTVRLKADAGVVISASHNPFEHNGIKMFSDEGKKIKFLIAEPIREEK